MRNNMEQPGPTKEDAIKHLLAVRQVILQTGRVDFEIDALKEIETKLENGDMTPIIAMEEADNLTETRQDYN
jgi:hypothetical protein